MIMLFAFAAPSVKKQIGKVRRLSRFVIWKMIPLNMARAKRRPFKIYLLISGKPSSLLVQWGQRTALMEISLWQ